ncbi:MAG: PKD domain-containing protein [Gemmatimonadota bacterium]
MMKSKSSHTPGAKLGALAVAALAIALWLSCTGETQSPSAPEPAGSLALSGGTPDLARAIAAQERITPRLMAIPGIVGTAVGLNPAGRPVVKVFAAHAGVSGIPDRVDDIPVTVEVTGLFVAGSNPTTKQRPAPLGFSVGHPDITAGTLGARVKDGSGNLYILSNNHVLANSNDASIGDPTLQPGPFDGGTSADQVGTLADFQTINFSGGNNTMDAAVSATTAANTGFATPTDDGYGAPSATIINDENQVLGLNVKKYGRTTELTQGQVTEINVTVSVCYEVVFIFCTKSATFVDQLGIAGGSFSAGGDSGSLIVSQSGNNPVGLLFAGSDTRTLANRIGPVLNRFDVTVDDGSGGGGNNPPTASFTFSCTDLSCSFDGSGSADPDGSIVSYAWSFGDGSNGSGETVNHTYAASDTYTVTLTVTDNDGATDGETQNVTVSEGGGGGFSLTATGYKVRGLQKADLEWSGATSSNIDVFRDASKITTTANDGFYTDNINNRGGGTYTYRVCEAGTSTCSNEAVVDF